MACYREIYEDKKKAILQSSLDKFVRKAERPPPSTYRQPSTFHISTAIHLLQ
jgi:hypothetical protein